MAEISDYYGDSGFDVRWPTIDWRQVTEGILGGTPIAGLVRGVAGIQQAAQDVDWEQSPLSGRYRRPLPGPTQPVKRPSSVTTGTPKKKGPPSGTMAGQTAFGNIGGALDFLSQQRQWFADQRDRAIKQAGRGAGAPYAAQIARLDNEIAKASRDLGNVGGLFEGKISRVESWWDESIGKMGTAYDAPIAEVEGLRATGAQDIRNIYSASQANTFAILDSIPGMDENTKAAAAETVGIMEDAIINLQDVSSAGTLNIMQASENLAVALAEQSKANTTLEFTRNKMVIEEGLKSQINAMIEDKKQAQRQQRAAIDAARAEAAARLPDNFPMDETGLAIFSGQKYIDDHLGNLRQIDRDTIQGAFATLYGLGVSPTDARKLLQRPAYASQDGRPLNDAARILERMNYDEDQWYEWFGNWNHTLLAAGRSSLPYALQMGEQAHAVWESYAGKDPYQYDPDSLDFALAYTRNYGSWQSQEEMQYGMGAGYGAYVSDYPRATTRMPQSSTRSATRPTTPTKKKPVSPRFTRRH